MEAIGAPGSGAGLFRLRISTTPGQLSIDTTQGRREMGYLHLTELAYDGRDYSRSRAALGVGDIVAAGDRLARAATGENTIAALAFERMLLELRDRNIQLGFIPRSPPAISYTPGQLTIDFVA